jgi:putative tryptophan/tyrosine transport system substrate-binding protein
VRRREFIALVGSAVTWPLPLLAQQRPAMPVIGFLNSSTLETYAPMIAAFHKGLREAGFTEGQNVVIEYRWAEGDYARLPALAADLVRRQVTVIAATSTPAAPAAKAATTTIPIVFTMGDDPVQLGLVASLNRPGGNITGATLLAVELGPKRLELLHQVLPTATILGLLVNPTNPNADRLSQAILAAAGRFGLQLHVIHATTERDFETIFPTLRQLRASALVIGSGDPFFNSRSKELATLAVRHAIPAIYQYREFVMAGGLISYGGRLTDSYHQAGVYVGRILGGAKPADLPVQQSTNVELIINLKTAKALGVVIPPALLARADEVIE